MATAAYVNLLRFYDPQGNEMLFTRYQNYFIDESTVWDGISYTYLPFALSSGAGVRGGERSGETLALGLDELSASIATEAVTKNWRVKVVTVLLDPITDALVQAYTAECWECNSYEQKAGALSINLRSPFDAVQRQYPARVLSQRLVGTLPATGNVTVGT